MDNKRVFLWATLGFLVWFNIITWQRDYAPPVTAPTSEATQVIQPTDALPTLPQQAGTALSAQVTTAPASVTNTPVAAADTIDVMTDVLAVKINLQGGTLQRADLLHYPVHKNDPSTPVRLLSEQAPVSLLRSGLIAADAQAAPNHLAIFTAAAKQYQLQDGQTDLAVTLTWTDGQGVTVHKTYTFHRGRYTVDLTYAVENKATHAWTAASYVQLFRHHVPIERSMFNVESYAYRGPEVFDGKSVYKLDIKDSKAQHFTATYTTGWLAAMQHHFVVAAVPHADQAYEYTLTVDATNDYTLGFRGPLFTVAAGGNGQFAEKIFVGPKLQSQLNATGAGLDLTADYGHLTIISKPLFWLLEKVHGLVKNWGLSIILVTLLIKLAFYRLTAASGRSMAKMRTIAPRIKAIQERYKDDREQLGRAMMDIYKREKINPLAGCLPILIQIPVFMGFYWVLLESVEMRQAPFLGWITDLSSRDPYFILPIIMGAANYVQFKLNPAPPDPMQAKIFAFMPLVMTVMMAWFPSGMVLYWITNTVLSALQQWRINKVMLVDAGHST